ncbi:hypothetical protein FAUST_2711 [Fusarium austroamericanum]|uniref:NB-ARC domain-containing protein n=1 Tax=Fusarium austroamericanum TaxID=282268 RepID=A0AAN6C672_FUSAU|nr:hypothetical protein FAUST_2711 [Fusarium austroamericanum]
MSHRKVVASTISDAILLCTNAFSHVLLRAISGQKVPDLAMLKEHHARFVIWAEDLRVSPESNDSPEDHPFHPHHAPDAKNVIDKPEETNDEDEYSSDSSLGIREDDNMEGELELATESHFATNKHTQFIGEIISHLYRFTSIVNEQYIDAEDQRINQWVLGEGQKLDYQLDGLKLYMPYLLDSDFPTLQPYLRDRLIHTVVHRRIRLLYQQDCSLEIDRCMDCWSNSKEQELASKHQDTPNIRPYICLFQNCNTPLRQFTTKNDWINHMSSQHAQVWVCQVKGHETYLFRNPADLEAHLQGQHADIICTDQVSFLAAKSARASSDILGALATENMSENSEKLPACPFCNLSASVFEPTSQLTTPAHCPTAEDLKETHRKVHDHISEHLKLIAHESIPPALQTPRPTSLRNFKFAIICVSYLTARAVYGLFNEYSNMDHLFQRRIDDMNSYSLAAIGRHNVVLVDMSMMGKVDVETIFSDIRRSFPCIELFMLADAYQIIPPSSNVEISFGDVIVGDTEERSLMIQQRPDLLNLDHKPGARVRSLLAKMRTPEARKMVQQRMSTNLEVFSEFQSLATTYRSTEHSKDAIQISHRKEDQTKLFHNYQPERQSNGVPEPRFHFGAIGSRRSSLALQIAERDDINFGTEKTGESLESSPHLVIQSSYESRAYWENNDERESYAATTTAAFVSAILDLWPSMSSTETSAIYDPVHHIPIPKNEHFVERKTSMKALQDKLFRDGTEQVTIYGSDGNGKTQLALWLAYWIKDNMQNYSVFWAASMSKDALEQDCRQIVKRLGDRCIGDNDPKVALQRYLNSDSSGRWILILDGASDEDLTYGQNDHSFEISKFLPDSRKGLILVTTECTEVARVGDAVVKLPYMTQEESLSLLSRSLVNNLQEFKDAIHTLREYGYIRRSAQIWLEDQDFADHHRGAIAAHLVRILAPDNMETRQLWNQYLPQILHLLMNAKHFNLHTGNLGCLVGRYLHQNGRVEESIKVFERLLMSQGDALLEDVAQKAVDLLEHVVAMRDVTLAESHPDRLESQSELAMAYQENGQHGKAAELLEHLTAVRENTDAEDSPDLLKLQHQLANAYLSTGMLDEGNKLLKHVKTVEGKLPSDEHPEQKD